MAKRKKSPTPNEEDQHLQDATDVTISAQSKNKDKVDQQEPTKDNIKPTLLEKVFNLVGRVIQMLIALILVGFLTNLLFLRVQRQNVQFDQDSRMLITLSDNKTVFSTYCVSKNEPQTSFHYTVLIEGSIGSFHQGMERVAVHLVHNEQTNPKSRIQVCSYDRLGVGLFSSADKTVSTTHNETVQYLKEIEEFYEKFVSQSESPVVVVGHGYGANLFSRVFFSPERSKTTAQKWRHLVKNVILIDPILLNSQWDQLSVQNTVQQFLALSGLRRLMGKVLFDTQSGIQFFRSGLFNVHSLLPGPYDLSKKSLKLKLERKVILNDQNIYEQANKNLKRLKDNGFLKPVSSSPSTTHVRVLLTGALKDSSVTLLEDKMWWKSQAQSHKIDVIEAYGEATVFNRLSTLISSAINNSNQ